MLQATKQTPKFSNSVIMLLIITSTSVFPLVTTMEEGESQTKYDDIMGSVNLFTGNASYSKQLFSFKLPSGLNVGVTLRYSSNIMKQVRGDNQTSPTSWVGLGWNLNFGAIICDHNNTRTHSDDKFKWISLTGYSSHIYEKDGKYFIEDKPYSKLTPIIYEDGQIIKGWRLTEPDGTCYLYGGEEHPERKATRCTFRWDWYVGETRLSGAPAVGPELYPYRWDLSEIVDQFGNSIAFSYTQSLEALKASSWNSGDMGKRFTRASYLKSIENSKIGKIRFLLTPKESKEFVDPYTMPIDGVYSEPDNFIEFYEDSLLSKAEIYSPTGTLLKTYCFNYSKINGELDGNYKKSQLTKISEEIQEYFKITFPINFTYYDDMLRTDYDSLYHYGALKGYKDEKGLEVEYQYSKKAIPFEAKKKIDLTGFGDAFVTAGYTYQGYPYACVTNKSKMHVYNWDGSKWKERTEVSQNPFSSDNSVPVDSVLASKDFFMVCGGDDKYCIYNWDGEEWVQKIPVTAISQTEIPHEFKVGFNVAGLLTIDPVTFSTQYATLLFWDGKTWHQEKKTLPSGWEEGNIHMGKNCITVNGWRYDQDYQAFEQYLKTYNWNGVSWTEQQIAHTPSMLRYYPFPAGQAIYVTVIFLFVIVVRAELSIVAFDSIFAALP